MSLNYAVRITRPNGKRSHVQLEAGTDAAVPEATRWDVDVPGGATPDDVRRIVEDLNRRGPPAVGLHGILGLKAQHVSAFAELRNLIDVTLAAVDDAGLLELAKHPGLEDIGVLDAEEVTDAGFAYLSSLTKLRHLELVVSGRITDQGLFHLSNCTKLEQLSLGENHGITSRGAMVLRDLPWLRELSLVSRKLTSDDRRALKRKLRATSEQYRAKKRVAKAPPPAEGELAPAVVGEIERLGGRLHEPTRPPPELDELSLPPPLRQLLFGVQWPEGHAYENDQDMEPWVWGVQLGTQTWTPDLFDAFPFCEGRPFALLGVADFGNYLLAIPLDRESPSDPVVHVIDHEETSEDDELDEGILLSELLATLQPAVG